MPQNKRPEILAPVGTWAMCQAAVYNGADAIYVGMPYFNARGRTQDFSIEELKQIIDFCHLYGVQVFLAFNVLIFENELLEAEELLREIIPLGPDAFIVQDIGLVRLIKKLAPNQVVHASTQMTVSNSESIELTSDLDISRYVLAREVSIPEMEKIRKASEKELEIFVHGALCVSYSGQCLTSESNGGRSANRGQCAQSCRLDYQLFVDGKQKDLGDKRYLVSPQDLCGINDIEKLVEIGIDSFKIEGRLKSPEYVASTVRNYSEVTDEAFRGASNFDLSSRNRELGLTFSRGKFNGWMDGVNHQKLVDARFSRPNGNYLGNVISATHSGIEISGNFNLEAGDGLLFCDFKSKAEIGGIVFGTKESESGNSIVWLGKEFDFKKITIGMDVFNNSSSLKEKEIRKSFEDKNRQRKIKVFGKLEGKAGEQLKFTLSDQNGNTVEAVSEAILQPAKSAPLNLESASAELGALSSTAFKLESLDWKVLGDCFIHNKELKELRRNAIDSISKKRTEIRREIQVNNEEIETWINKIKLETLTPKKSSAQLSVLIRDESQLEALQNQEIKTVYLDYEFNKDYERSLKAVREMGFECGIATTRIMKPGEQGHLKYIERLKPDKILVRNLGALQFYKDKDIKLAGDFSLNISNSLTASWFMNKGLSSICPSYDLNQWQLLDLISAVSPDIFEITVHQYMPAFHMEHCVFAAFLSNGTSFKDCGRPCEKHKIELRDPYGTSHPVKVDAECRNTMFQGKPQAAVRLIPDLLVKGVKNFRLEALFESASELSAKISAYSRLVLGKVSAEEAVGSLGLVEKYGVTEGQLFNSRVYEDRKKSRLEVIGG